MTLNKSLDMAAHYVSAQLCLDSDSLQLCLHYRDNDATATDGQNQLELNDNQPVMTTTRELCSLGHTTENVLQLGNRNSHFLYFYFFIYSFFSPISWYPIGSYSLVSSLQVCFETHTDNTHVSWSTWYGLTKTSVLRNEVCIECDVFCGTKGRKRRTKETNWVNSNIPFPELTLWSAHTCRQAPCRNIHYKLLLWVLSEPHPCGMVKRT